jgi:hypothetical protein
MQDADNSVVAALQFSVPVKVAGQILHRSRAHLYELAGDGLLDMVRSGNRSEITVESIKRYQASLPRNVIAQSPRRAERARKKAAAK